MKISETHRYERRNDDSVMASAYIRIPTKKDEPVMVSRLRTNKSYRRLGLATSLMREIVGDHGKDRDLKLGVCPEKSCGLTKDDLYEFYGRFGFVRKDDSQVMLRSTDEPSV